MSTTKPTGVLLLQLGTPDSTSVDDVRSYLREFLSDSRVLDVPAPVRSLLLNGIILPFRPRRSAEAYEKIWTDDGSPLVIHTEALRDKVQARLGEAFRVEFGMRYKNPTIESALKALTAAGVERIVILPLFPQYASASGGSAVAKTLEIAAAQWNVPDVTTIGAFYDDPGFVEAAAAVAAERLAGYDPDHVLFSYHGLPEKQVKKSDTTGEWCLQVDDCCATINDANRFCYRAQCFATTRALVDELGLEADKTSTTFQSRLAGQKWIEPYTDKVLPKLYKRGVRKLAILTPSFTADCLETIEEIGIRGRDQWEGLGGEDLLLIPCVNASDEWAAAVAGMVATA